MEPYAMAGVWARYSSGLRSACRAISFPRSQVNDRRRCSGRGNNALVRASRTASDPYPDSAGPFFTGGIVPYPILRGRCSSTVNLLVRSTTVPIAERFNPIIKSP